MSAMPEKQRTEQDLASRLDELERRMAIVEAMVIPRQAPGLPGESKRSGHTGSR